MSRLFPGSQAVWRIAAILGVLLGGLIAYEVALVERPYLTGTNSTYGRSPSAVAKPGDEVCAYRLDIPRGTRQVRFEVEAARPGARLAIDLRAGSRVARGTSAPLGTGRQAGDVPVTPLPIAGESDGGRLCVRVRGATVRFWGVFELRSDDVAPTVNRTRKARPLAIYYLPAPGEKRPLVSSLGDIVDRAALFRPSFIGPWAYLLLLLLMPVLAYGAVRTLALAADEREGRLPAALAIGLLAFANAACWSLITPAFDAPDEMEHYAHAQYLAETGNSPCQRCSKQVRSTEELLAVDAVRLISYIESADGRPPWLQVNEQRWRRAVDRRDPRRDDGGGVTTASSHSPAYYGLLVPAYGAALAADGSVFSRLALMRLMSALLGALTAALAYLAVRELMPGHLPAVLAGLLVGFQPMFAFISGALNNDNAVNAAVALLAYLLVRALRRGLTPGLGAGIGAVLVAAPLFKLTGYVVWIPALVALPVLAWRQHGRGDIPAWAALVLTFAVLTLTWSLLSGAFDRSVYATPDSGIPGSQPTVSSARENIPGYLSYLWQIFLPPLPFMTDLHVQKWPAFDIYIERGFGAFGWYAIKFPMWVYLAIVLAIGAAAALGLRALWQSRASVRAVLPELLVLALLAAAVIAGTHASFYTPEPSRPVVAEQGRYAFTAMVPFAAFAAVAAYGLGHLRARAVAATMLAAMLALNVASQLLALGKFFS